MVVHDNRRRGRHQLGHGCGGRYRGRDRAHRRRAGGDRARRDDRGVARGGRLGSDRDPGNGERRPRLVREREGAHHGRGKAGGGDDDDECSPGEAGTCPPPTTVRCWDGLAH
ncbi:hypothetical protein E3O46_05820 [Cryobacterium glucosi]|uniref:Uncharacterized protein n=1 Tax=Cryobacterium glucosi TaxID=1259175 RepID=A0ABY2IP86_9MICO|nr:hypothetical protein E3O46_05820 [Cryobacterium glucosi]